MFTFTFERYNRVNLNGFHIILFHVSILQVTAELLGKLQTAREMRSVVVTSPSSVKSFVLKFIEICHNLNRQKHLKDEKRFVKVKKSFRNKISQFLGLSRPKLDVLSPEEIEDFRFQASVAEEIFEIFRDSVEIMDEVDIILHPLKSELNWPLGMKEPLDFTRSSIGNGLRWGIPSHLLDAIFFCCGLPVLADIAESRQASEFFHLIIDEIFV